MEMTAQEFEAALVHFHRLVTQVEADGRQTFHADLGVGSRVGVILARDKHDDHFTYEVNYETGALSVYKCNDSLDDCPF